MSRSTPPTVAVLATPSQTSWITKFIDTLGVISVMADLLLDSLFSASLLGTHQCCSKAGPRPQRTRPTPLSQHTELCKSPDCHLSAYMQHTPQKLRTYRTTLMR